jgi:hypothetical protein
MTSHCHYRVVKRPSPGHADPLAHELWPSIAGPQPLALLLWPIDHGY